MSIQPVRTSHRIVTSALLLFVALLLVGVPLSALPTVEAALNIPTITWPAPAAIPYGTAISSTQLNASVLLNNLAVAGTLSYSPDVGTILNAGNHTLHVIFDPSLPLLPEVEATVQLQVDPAPLTITANTATRVYGENNPSLTYSVAGLISGDSINVLSGNLQTSATPSSPAGTYPITIGTLKAANYALNFVANDLTVKKAPLTVHVSHETRKIGQANPPFTLTYTGFVNNETASVLTALPQATTIADINSSLGTYPITLSGGGALNYVLTYDEATLTVTAEDIPIITWQAPTAITYGSPLTNAQLNASALFNSAAVAGNFEYDPPIGTVLNAGTHLLHVAFDPDDGGIFAPVGATVEVQVNKAPLTVTANSLSRMYGGENPLLTYGVAGLVPGDDVNQLLGDLTTDAAATSPVGTYPISLGDLNADNYAITFVPGMLTVTKAPLTVQAHNETRKVNLPNPVFTLTYIGFVNNDAENVLTALPHATTAALENSPVGSYAINISGGQATNYDLISIPGTLTITAKDVPSIDWPTPPAITYGTPLSNIQLSASALFNSALVPGSFSYDPPVTTILDAGSHTLHVAFMPDDIGNFAPLEQTVEVQVNKAPVIVTADSTNRVYGDANPKLTYHATGLVNGDSPGVLEVNLETDAELNSSVGEYSITAGTLDALNYVITFVPGTLSVTKAPLFVRVDDQTRKVGQSNLSFVLKYDGFMNNETENDLDVPPQAASLATENSPAGIYPITISGGEDSNYSFIYIAGALTITNKEVPIIDWTAPDAITYGTPLSGFQLSAKSLTSGLFSYDPPAGTVLPAGTNTIHVTFTPQDLINNATVGETVQIVVNTAPLTITATDLSRPYGSANPPLTYVATGFVNSENEGVLSGLLETNATSDSPAGDYPISLGSLDADNYTISFTPGTLTITKVQLIATADTMIRQPGTPNPPLTISYEGFVNGDDATNLDVPPQATTTAIETSPLGTYPITVSGGDDDSYAFTYIPGTLTITNKSIPSIDWATPAAITYGTPLNNVQLNASATSGSTPVAGTFSYDPPAGTVLSVGVHTMHVTFTPQDTATYATVEETVLITVGKAPLTVTANNVTVTAGNSIPTLTVTASGFVHGDTVATAVSGAPATSATQNSPVGSYPIGQGTLEAANYAITFVPGTVTINPAPASGPTLTVTSPLVGRPGSVFVFSASGFTPGATVNLSINGRTINTLVVNSSGVAVFAVLFPASLPAGDYILVMQQQDNRAALAVNKTAQAIVTLDPNAPLLPAPSGISVFSVAYQVLLPIVRK